MSSGKLFDLKSFARRVERLSETELWLLIVYWMGISSLLLFGLMGLDKYKARRKQLRVPEKTLFSTALLGGAVGGILGMIVFRHKTRHAKFQVGFPLFVVAQVVLVYFVYSTS